jgi:hypothetical protein
MVSSSLSREASLAMFGDLFSPSALVLLQSDADPAGFIFLGELNSGFLKGRLDPEHG